MLNVRGGSVLPCGAGVRVLFQYPECVLERADRVRVFGRDRDRLRYVAERRVTRLITSPLLMPKHLLIMSPSCCKML